jgi:hypothetical protein
MRRILLGLLLVILIIAAVVGFRLMKQPIADENGNQLRYSYDEIEKEGRTGIFVLNEDGTFSPCISQMPNFQGETSNFDYSRYVWYVETDDEVSKLIPTVTGDAKLVAIFDKDEQLAESHYLEKYRYKGYTIGAHIIMDSDKTLRLSGEDTLSGSQASSVILSMEDNTDNEYEIAEISGSDVLPINNIDTNMNLLLGLDGGKLYQIKYYRGTKEETQTFKADTKVYQSERYIPINNPYTKTNKGYFEINLPENVTSGYYYISDMGFFAIKR